MFGAAAIESVVAPYVTVVLHGGAGAARQFNAVTHKMIFSIRDNKIS